MCDSLNAVAGYKDTAIVSSVFLCVFPSVLPHLALLGPHAIQNSSLGEVNEKLANFIDLFLSQTVFKPSALIQSQ